MHKPIFHSDVTFSGEHMKDEYEDTNSQIIKKWSPAIESTLTQLNFNKLNYTDRKILTFYFEWLSRYDNYSNQTTQNNQHNGLITNVNSFRDILFSFINSDEMNFEIIGKVYNPLLKKPRYKVLKGGKEIIMDEDYKKDDSLLISLYPLEFLGAIGMTQKKRAGQLKKLLQND